MADSRILGRFVWHELMTLDVPAAISFYSNVVGWSTQSWDADASYTMWVASNGPIGGVMLLPDEAKAMGTPPSWMTYIATPDVDATAEEARSLGATILRPPSDIPNGGRFAILSDPQGAVFAIYRPEPNAPPMADDPPAIGEISWHELATTDLQAGFEFYRALFGWEKVQEMDMGPELGIYLLFGWNGTQQGGMYRKPDNMPAPPNWLPYAMVGDARGAAGDITANGGSVMMGPHEVPGGDWIVMGMDPQGAAFAVHSKGMAASAAPAESAPMERSPEPSERPAAPAKAAAPAKKSAPARKKAAAAKPKKAVKKKAAKKAAKKAKRRPVKKAARKAARKPARRKAAKKKAAKRPARKKAARKAAKRPVRRKAARKAAKRPVRRKAARKAAKRPVRRKAAKRGASRSKPRKRK